MIKLSVITINYNNANELRRTIQSLINQTWKNFEFIIIDGGSSDKSIEIIKEYSNYINYWISESDKGIYHAMNKGIGVSKGEYCFFLNSGDYLADERVFERVFENEAKEDLIFGNLYVTIGGRVIGKALGKDILAFSDVYANVIKHQASFIKRNLFDRFGPYNEGLRVVSDWEFFLKTIGLGNATYRYINTFISYFDNSGVSNRNKNIIRQERDDIIYKNIPKMMHPDYEFLEKYIKYHKVFHNKYSFFLVRVVNKILEITPGP